MRLIDADDMEYLEELEYEYHPEPNGEPWYRVKDVWDCIEKEHTVDPASLRPKGEWISIEDRLPAYGQHVIVYTGRMMMAEVSTTYFWNEAYDAWQPVSHWMPLPEPPNCGADMRGNPHDS